MCLRMHGLDQDVIINPYSNVMIAPLTTRLSISTEDFFESKAFLINTFGVSGAVRIPKIKKRKDIKERKENPIDHYLDPN